MTFSFEMQRVGPVLAFDCVRFPVLISDQRCPVKNLHCIKPPPLQGEGWGGDGFYLSRSCKNGPSIVRQIPIPS